MRSSKHDAGSCSESLAPAIARGHAVYLRRALRGCTGLVSPARIEGHRRSRDDAVQVFAWVDAAQDEAGVRDVEHRPVGDDDGRAEPLEPRLLATAALDEAARVGQEVGRRLE